MLEVVMAVDGGARPTSEVSVDRQPMMTFRQIMLMNVGFFGIQYSFGMQQCDPGQALLSVAEERGADLIVVGNRGINTLSARLLGSVPSDVSHRALCDVLIVRTTEAARASLLPWAYGRGSRVGRFIAS